MTKMRGRSWGQLAAASALSIGAVLSVRALFRPLDKSQRILIDWTAVRRAAMTRTGEDDEELDVAAELGGKYDAFAAELAPLMAEVCGTAPTAFPAFTVIDRRAFIDFNLRNLQQLLAPVEAARNRLPASQMTVWTRQLSDRYLGELFGFMSKRVLGQYDPVLLPNSGGADVPSSALYLVEPNIRAFERGHSVPGDDLRRWLILHELTHAWQFENHPWLKDHLVAITNKLLEGVVQVGTPAKGKSFSTSIIQLPDVVRSQLRTIAEVQAIMSVLEGYSNFVMHSVGRKHIRDFSTLEAAFQRRQRDRTLLERLVLAITGMRLKLRQYEVGEKFAVEVAQSGGVELLNRVWESASMMPTLAELKSPANWIRRASAAA